MWYKYKSLEILPDVESNHCPPLSKFQLYRYGDPSPKSIQLVPRLEVGNKKNPIRIITDKYLTHFWQIIANGTNNNNNNTKTL